MAKDPYKYFRVEAREILDSLSQGILELEAGAAAPQDAVAGLLRRAHTLKGAARVVKQPRIAEAAHAMEDVLARYRETGAPVDAESTSGLLRFVDSVSAMLSSLDAPAAAPTTFPARRSTPPLNTIPPVNGQAEAAAEPGAPLAIAETVRIEIQEMDALLHEIGELGVRVSGIRQSMSAVAQAQLFASALAEELRSAQLGGAPASAIERGRALAKDVSETLEGGQAQLLAGLERTERELVQLRDLSERLRLVTASSIFAPLLRAVRDAAATTGKSVELETSGGEVRLEAHMLSALRDALLHVVRNAVAHGIESPAERAALGKSATGRIELRVERRGSRVAFVCRDDGRGIDVAAVARAGMERGLLSPAEAATLDMDRAAAVIFKAGVSTTSAVDEVSGRGVGLDVVQEVVTRFQGELSARSEPGRGTTIDICLPISLSSITALGVETSGQTAWVPLDAVLRTLYVGETDVARANGGDALVYEDRAVPFIGLEARLAQGARSPRRGGPRPVLVLRAGGVVAAVGVDRLRGVAPIVVRPLPRNVRACTLVAGAAFDSEGTPELVLDPRGLVQAALAAPPPATRARARRPSGRPSS